jgi:hypothetical protein
MQIQKTWFATLPVFVLAVACSDARTTTGPTAQAVQYELIGTATVATECQVQIDALMTLTQAAPITSKNAERDRAGLVKILSDASALLTSSKNADAVKKLTDYVVKVEQLEAAGRLDSASADQLVAGADNAIACINAIGAQ